MFDPLACRLCEDQGFNDAVCPLCEHPQVEYRDVPKHTHDWIDVSNSVVLNTALCVGCMHVTELDKIEMTTKTLDELRALYPNFPWRNA